MDTTSIHVSLRNLNFDSFDGNSVIDGGVVHAIGFIWLFIEHSKLKLAVVYLFMDARLL